MNSTLSDLNRFLLERVGQSRDTSNRTRLPGGTNDQRLALLQMLEQHFAEHALDSPPGGDPWTRIEALAAAELGTLKAAEAALTSC